MIYFTWYHSITGTPSTQSSINYEKSSVLFNIGCLYAQVGAKINKQTEEGLDFAVDNFLRAAGIFLFIKDNFSNDLDDDVGTSYLTMLKSVMVCQARECLLQKSVMEGEDDLELCQEAAYVQSVYNEVLSQPLPYSWLDMIQVKMKHYQALSDYYIARGVTSQGVPSARRGIYHTQTTTNQRQYLGRAHLRSSLLILEDVILLTRSIALYELLEDEDDFQEVLEPPSVVPSTKYQLSLSYPSFTSHQVTDLFSCLGPEPVFCAQQVINIPRTALITRREGGRYG